MSTYKPLVTINGHVEQLDDPDGLSVAHITDTDYIDFDLTPNVSAHQTGRLHWHEDDGTLSLGLAGSEVELQMGQEHLILVTNITGNTINNGTPVYFTGVVSGGRSAVATANAARNPNPVPSFVRGLLTETINTGNEGYMLIAGLMREVNTANWAPGTQLFLATTAGEYTNPRPEAPNNVRGLGVVIKQDTTEGSILVSLDPIYDLEWASNVYSEVPFETDQFLGWQPGNSRYELLRSQRNFFNGTTRETFDAVIAAPDTGNIVLSLEQAGGGDLTLQFTEGDSQLDCTPAQTINITPGTDTSPAGTMVYIPISTKVLTTNTTWPDEEHIKICYMAVPSSQFVFDHGGPYVNQNWNDHLSDTEGVVGQGHLSHIAGKIRLALGASWYSGVSPDGVDVSYFTYPGASDIRWESTVGEIAQLHPQVFGAKDTGNGNIILVANDFVAPYTHVSNLFDITDDSTGSSIINNRYFSLIFWGVQNKSDQGSGVVVNLPSGNYTSETGAVLDTSGYDDYNFPREFTLDSGTAFLICRSTFKMGTTGWTHIQTEDLRGKFPSNQVGGGGGGGVTDHGALGGLADDDHTQYALADGTRAFTGNITLTSANMSGYITGYGGTPTDGQVLGWVTANTRFEPTTNPAGVTDHGALTGLADNDHTQYALLDGTQEFTGNVTVNAQLTVNGAVIVEDSVTANVLAVTESGSFGGPLTVNSNTVPGILSIDKTLYVRSTGSDLADGLTVNTPFATINKAINTAYQYIADDNTITINLGADQHTSAALDLYSLSNENLIFEGVSESSVNAAVTAVGSITGGPAGFDYIDITATIPDAYTITVNDYIIVKSATGGANPVWAIGNHEIISWSSGNREAIFRVFRANGTTPVPNTSVTLAAIDVIKTTIAFSASNGVNVRPGTHGGTWSDIVLAGPGLIGVYLNENATIRMNNCGTSQWEVGVKAEMASVFNGGNTWHSYAEAGIQCYTSAIANVSSGAVTGTSGYGVEVALCGCVSLNGSYLIACGDAVYAAFVYRAAYVDFTSSFVRPGNNTIGLRVEKGSGLDLTSYSNTYTTPYQLGATGYVN